MHNQIHAFRILKNYKGISCDVTHSYVPLPTDDTLIIIII